MTERSPIPSHARELLAAVEDCKRLPGTAVVLTERGGFKVWVRGSRDRGGFWHPGRDAKVHMFSAGLALFDHGLVRMEQRRLVLIEEGQR